MPSPSARHRHCWLRRIEGHAPPIAGAEGRRCMLPAEPAKAALMRLPDMPQGLQSAGTFQIPFAAYQNTTEADFE